MAHSLRPMPPLPPPPSAASSAPAVSRPGGHIDFLDFIRGVAILMVLAFHALGASYGLDHLHWRRFLPDFVDAPPGFVALTPFTFGWIGVAVFFAVSGFCIHLSHVKSREAGYAGFFLRRFFRIYPPYLAALCFFAFLFPLATSSPEYVAGAGQFWSHALLVNNVTSDLHYGINPSFWSVVVEVQLYVIYPLLLWMVRRFGWGAALAVCGVLEFSLRLTQGVQYLPYWVLGSPFYYWFSWAIGAKLADDYLNGRPLFLARWPLWFWPLVTIGSNLFRPACTLTFAFGALASTQWMAHWLSLPTVPAVGKFLGRFVTRVGVVSYSLYLINQPLLHAFGHWVNHAAGATPLPPFFLFIAALFGGGALMLLGAAAVYRWVEVPSIEWGRRVRVKLTRPREGRADGKIEAGFPPPSA